MLGHRWAKVFAAFIALFVLSCAHGESAPKNEPAPKATRQASTTTGFTWDGMSKDTFAGPTVAQLFVPPGYGMHLDQIELPQIGGNYDAYVYITTWDTESNRPSDSPEDAIYKSPLIPAGAAGPQTLTVDSSVEFDDFSDYAIVFTMAEAVGPYGFGADQANPATVSYGFGDDANASTYLSGVRNGGDARIGLDANVTGSDWGSPFGLYFPSDLAYTLTWRRATETYASASAERTVYGEPLSIQIGSGFLGKGILYQEGLTETVTIPTFGAAFTKTAVTTQPPKGGSPYATVTYNDIPVTDTGDGNPGVDITATFAGNSDFGPSSDTIRQLVDYGTAKIALDRDSGSVGLGTPVTFTATLTPEAPSVVTPAGKVHFADIVGQAPVQSADVDIDATGKAVWKPSFGSLGSHLVTAVYQPVAKTYRDTSTSTEIDVFTIPTTTTLSSTQNPATLGADAKIRASVTSQAGTPTGKVHFIIDGTPVPDVDLSGGVAEVSTSALPLGSHVVSASYLGAGTYAASAADKSLTQQIDKDAVAITVTTESPASPSTYAEDVSFVFKVASVSSGTTPTGTFSVSDGATSLATGVALVAGATPVVKLTGPAAGTHAIKFTYSGDASHSAASQTVNHVVNKVAPVLTFVDSGDSKFGQAFTLTAKIAQVGPTPASGTVDFFEGANLLGSAIAPPWTLSRNDLAVGTHTIVAKYSGDSNYLAITDSAHTATHVVAKAATTTQIASATNPSPVGAPVALTVIVAPSVANAVIPSGEVNVLEGATVKGSGTLDAAGHLTLNLGGLGVGAHTLRAVYAGDASYATSTSANLVQTVARNTTAITVTSSKSPSTFGESVTFVAHVPSANDKDATGSVTFIDGANVIGTANVANTVAFVSTTALGTGSHVITVSYSGDANFLAGAASIAQIVDPAATTTALAIVPANALFGQATKLTATVTGATTGTVRFREGGVVIGTSALVGGVATLDKANWPVGVHSLSATFSGDTDHVASTGNASLVVSKADTSVTVTSSANPVAAGAPVSFTAVVAALSPGAGAPSGATVTFREGQTVLGTAGVGTGGVATFTTSLATGTHAITASVDPTASFNGSTSPAFTQTVSAAPITVALGTSSDHITFGDSPTFTVTVAGGAAPPAGDVLVTEGGATICTITLDAGGSGTCVASGLHAGTHTLTATFSGATSSTSIVVEKAPTTTTLTSSLNPAHVGDAITFTGTVTTGATGDVEVSITGTVLGTIALAGNTASKSVADLEAGTYVLTAKYLGDADHLESTSDVLTQVVVAAEADAGADASTPPDASTSGGTSSGNNGSSSSSSSSSSGSAPPSSTADAGGASGGLGAIPVGTPGGDDDGCSTTGPGTGGSAMFGIALALAGWAARRRRTR